MFRLSKIISFPSEVILSYENLVVQDSVSVAVIVASISSIFYLLGGPSSFIIFSYPYIALQHLHLCSNGLIDVLFGLWTDCYRLCNHLGKICVTATSLSFFIVLCSNVQFSLFALSARRSMIRTSLLLFWSKPTFGTNQHSVRTHTDFSSTLSRCRFLTSIPI